MIYYKLTHVAHRFAYDKKRNNKKSGDLCDTANNNVYNIISII